MTDQYHARALRIITAALVLLTIAALLRGCAPTVTGQGAHIGDCLPGLVAPVAGLYDLTDLDMAALRNIPASGSFWVADGAGYGRFAIPADNVHVTGVRGDVVGGDPDFYDAGVDVFGSPTTPDVVYVLVYADLTPDEPGAEHEGTHPCAALVVSTTDWFTFQRGIERPRQ